MRCYKMQKTGYCLLPIFCQLWSLQAYSLEALVAQSNIYYQRPAQLGHPTELLIDNVEQLQPVQSLKLIIHGFLGSRTHKSIMPLINAYKAQGYENILIADWSPAANLDYASSRYAINQVALHLAKQLQLFLDHQNVPPELVHILGHSLGAHIAGRMGHYFKGTLGRITGLDPALPLFAPHSTDSLQPNAAQFVDVIHTDFPVFGDLTPRGTADFYPNFGHAPQPGCENIDILTASKLILEAYSCSHNRAVLLYAESVGLPKNFPAVPCSLKAIRNQNVDGCLKKMKDWRDNGVDIDEDRLIYMGEQLNHSATLSFYLETNEAPPFGQAVHSRFF